MVWNGLFQFRGEVSNGGVTDDYLEDGKLDSAVTKCMTITDIWILLNLLIHLQLAQISIIIVGALVCNVLYFLLDFIVQFNWFVQKQHYVMCMDDCVIVYGTIEVKLIFKSFCNMLTFYPLTKIVITPKMYVLLPSNLFKNRKL